MEERTHIELTTMSKKSSEAGSLVVVACCCLVLFLVGAGAAPGTPSAFRDIFIGRCEDYKLGGINKLADLSELR